MSKVSFLRIKFDFLTSGQKFTAKAIVSIIKKQIIECGGAYGLRLPPVRVLSHQLGISKNTVQRAYDELISQGIVESRLRQGLFIISDDKKIAITHKKNAKELSLDIGPCKHLVQNKISKDGIFLSSVFIDPNLLPKEKISECFRSVLKKPGLPVEYSGQGYLPLREKIATRLKKNGIEAKSEDIIITQGSQQAMDIISRLLVGKSIATENPSYYLGKRLFEINKIKTIGLLLDPFKKDSLANWENTFKEHHPHAVYLISCFHNPTGHSYSTSELHKIIDWSQKYNFGIIEDDWGSDMLSYSEFRSSLRAIGGENVIYINTFTKKLLPSLRIGYILGNSKNIPYMLDIKRASSLGNATIVEMALFEFLDRGYYDTHLKKLHTELDHRYLLCLELLSKNMPSEVRWTLPGGGPLLWLEIPKKMPLEKIYENLRKRNVHINISSEQCWFYGKPHLHGFPISYTYNSSDKLICGLELLAAELKKY